MTMKNVFTVAGVGNQPPQVSQNEKSDSASYTEKLHKARIKYVILFYSFTTFELGEFIFIFNAHCIRLLCVLQKH